MDLDTIDKVNCVPEVWSKYCNRLICNDLYAYWHIAILGQDPPNILTLLLYFELGVSQKLGTDKASDSKWPIATFFVYFTMLVRYCKIKKGLTVSDTWNQRICVCRMYQRINLKNYSNLILFLHFELFTIYNKRTTAHIQKNECTDGSFSWKFALLDLI